MRQCLVCGLQIDDPWLAECPNCGADLPTVVQFKIGKEISEDKMPDNKDSSVGKKPSVDKKVSVGKESPDGLIESVWPEWRLEPKPIGRGSFGTVYRAVRRDGGFESYSAIKVITIPRDDSERESLQSEGMDEEATRSYYAGIVQELKNEIQILQSLKGAHNIVIIEDYKIVEHEDSFGWDIHIRMELLTPLVSYIANKKLSESETVKLGCDICSALMICEEKQIIHRDIKPENIFISNFGDFKLGDFGVARKLEQTVATSYKGAPNYMAPEVVNGRNYDSRVDIYSLGIVLYRLLNNNRLPFVDPEKKLLTPADRDAAWKKRMNGEKLPAPCEASEAVGNAILKACEFKPDKRYATAEEFRDALTEASRKGSLVPVKKESRMKKGVLWAVGAVLLCALIVGGILLAKGLKSSTGNSKVPVLTPTNTPTVMPVSVATDAPTPTSADTPTPTSTDTPTPIPDTPTPTPIPDTPTPTPIPDTPTPTSIPDTPTPTPIPTYKVKYDANGGTGEPSAQTKKQGKKLTLSKDEPKRTGYIFQGWAVMGTDVVKYSAGATYNENADLTLVAVWKPEEYSVTYDANGGTGEPSEQKKKYDQKLTLSKDKPTRPGYTFQGWAVKGKDTVQYNPGDTYNGNAKLVLVAIWSQNRILGWDYLSAVPTEAIIVETKWQYDYTEIIESTDSSLSGWTLVDSYWKETGSDSKKYATFPYGFNVNNPIYYSEVDQNPYEAYENEKSKRVVENKEAGFVYWHWMYNVAYSDNTQRAISDRQGSFDASGKSGGYSYQYFNAFLSDVDCPFLDNLYCCSRNQASYNCVNVMPDKSSLGTGTPRYFRFRYYTSTYTDYEKVYKYSRTTTKESSSEVSEGGNISNVQVLVKWQMP